ncbi:MAG: flagellar assembly protein FliW, partial [Angelakisella sp.]
VNLKSPIIINTVRRCAAQVMLEEDYPVRAPLVAAK